MAPRPKKPCIALGCNVLTRNPRYCDKHAHVAEAAAKALARRHDSRRGSSTQRGYGYAWQKARAGYLRSHPLCIQCESNGMTTAATNVDHRVPHKGDQELFWDKTNWQALCASCHSSKTASEDGGFGNSPRRS